MLKDLNDDMPQASIQRSSDRLNGFLHNRCDSCTRRRVSAAITWKSGLQDDTELVYIKK